MIHHHMTANRPISLEHRMMPSGKLDTTLVYRRHIESGCEESRVARTMPTRINKSGNPLALSAPMRTILMEQQE
jgi:hypothetical protein